MTRCVVLLLLMLTLLFQSGGCGKFNLRIPTLRKPLPIEPTIEPAVWSPYPKDAELGDDWDIIVVQGRDSLALTNNTPRIYQNIQLWLNQQYVADIESINIGPENTIPLRRFINEHDETYPMPGFLAPDKAFPVLACEIFDPADGKRHRLHARQ